MYTDRLIQSRPETIAARTYTRDGEGFFRDANPPNDYRRQRFGRVKRDGTLRVTNGIAENKRRKVHYRTSNPFRDAEHHGRVKFQFLFYLTYS